MNARLAPVLACCALLTAGCSLTPAPEVPGLHAASKTAAEPEQHPRVLGAVWMTVEDSEPAAEEEETIAPVGLDAGVGAELVGRTFSQGRLSAVALGGTKSVGAGVSWAWRERGRPVAVGLAAVAPYDSGGAYVDEWAVAVVATVGLFGGGGRP